jgi:hypothetical protein
MTFAKLIKFCEKNGYEIERSPSAGDWHLPYDYEWRKKDDQDLNYNGSDTLQEAFSDILLDIEKRKREHEVPT